MRLIIFAKDDGTLEWNMVSSRQQLISFIEHNYMKFIADCGYDALLVSKRLLIIAVQDYKITPLQIVKPERYILSVE